MIKSSELRIGNYISWRDCFGGLLSGVVHEVHIDMVAISPKVREEEGGGQGFMLITGIEPIPLTPEWLERCGWQVVDQGSGQYYWLERHCWFHIHSYADGSLYANFNMNAVPIKYVHLLQNLYHALTCEELKTEERQ